VYTYISVQCGGQWVSPSQQRNEDTADPASGRTYLQTSVDISKDMVDQHGFTADHRDQGPGDYQCECHAWNHVPGVAPLRTRSRPATVHVACE